MEQKKKKMGDVETLVIDWMPPYVVGKWEDKNKQKNVVFVTVLPTGVHICVLMFLSYGERGMASKYDRCQQFTRSVYRQTAHEEVKEHTMILGIGKITQ